MPDGSISDDVCNMLYVIISSTRMQDKKINESFIVGVEQLRIPFSPVHFFILPFLYNENRENVVQNKVKNLLDLMFVIFL